MTVTVGHDSAKTRKTLTAGGASVDYYSISAAETAGLGDFSRLPAALKVVLENMLRFEDGSTVKVADVQAIVDWQGPRTSNHEINYRPARVLLQDARLIVLDEPFNAIDAKTTADLLDLVKRWNGEGRTVLAALHDLDMVRNNFPETLLLARGPVEWGPTAEALTAENLTVAMRMCEAFDDSAAACAADPRSRAA
jgi:ABC-type cobalamin transport system ATPase subunit